MIQFIVRLYKDAIGVAFIGGCAVAAFIFLSFSFFGSLAPFIAIGIFTATVFLTGASALLISINDHLQAIRQRDGD